MTTQHPRSSGGSPSRRSRRKKRDELQIHEEFPYGQRGLLRPGDRFRASGGPVYITGEGTEIRMSERGVFVFARYCVRGSARWIEAIRQRDGSTAVLWVGRSVRSRKIPGLLRRPYRISKVVGKRRPRRKRTTSS